jgi:hypothetical protein
MAFGALVQGKQNTNSSGASATPVFDAGATAGNLIICINARSTTADALGAPSGLSLIKKSTEGGGPNMIAGWWWGIASGGETNFPFSGGSEISGNWRTGLYEFEGPFATSPLDVSGDDITNLSTVVTSQSSNSSALPETAQADNLAICLFVAPSIMNVDGGRAYSNSFTEVDYTTTSTARAGFGIATRILNSIGVYTCTYTTTDTGDEMYGSIVIFKKLVSGGVPDINHSNFKDLVRRRPVMVAY